MSSLLKRLFGEQNLTIPGASPPGDSPVTPATVDPPPQFLNLRPPTVTRGAVPALKRADPNLSIWASITDVPPNARCLTNGQPGGVDLPEEMRKRVALFQLRALDGEDAGGSGSYCLGWSNSKDDGDYLIQVTSYLRQRNLTVGSKVEVTPDLVEVLNFGSTQTSGPVLEAGKDAGEAVDLLSQIISDAARAGASDVHLCIDGRQATVHQRLGQKLISTRVLPRDLALGIALATHNNSTGHDSTHFNTSNPVTENGKLLVTCRNNNGETYEQEVRWASSPTTERNFDVAFRLLGSTVHAESFTALGFDPDQDAIMQSWLESDSGLIAICGSTGSGKSTTLKTALEMLIRGRPGEAIHTIESPVEYRVMGARQRAVSGANTFASLVRQEMRMDPDIIMIGEVRDQETARAMEHAVTTGHMVLTTLHTSNQFTLIERLNGLGIDPVVLADKGFLAGIVHQMLVPRLCQTCAVPAAGNIPAHRARQIELCVGSLEGLKVPGHAPDCTECQGRGARGFTVLASLIQPDYEMLLLIAGRHTNLARLYAMSNRQQSLLGLPTNVLARSTQDHAITKMQRGEISALELRLERQLSAGEADSLYKTLRARSGT